MKCTLKQFLTMHLQAKQGQLRKENEHYSVKVECKEAAAHLLECPSLQVLKGKHGMETLKDGEVFFSAQLTGFLKELFKLGSPSAPDLRVNIWDRSSREEAPIAKEVGFRIQPHFCCSEVVRGVHCKSHEEARP
ncbi:hypothetical protein DPX39_040084600 [Trypanosoma brucei equiperdum]|uniref:Uncharacterized protein n=1 Tax=Trypanosoma brucei equiperdum TaxID=630700 RepID=A0A3L6LA00_9TRYP|nr:hypothetical protein DPX39_040084600 [Trypanosoma brucei equiperdum]